MKNSNKAYMVLIALSIVIIFCVIFIIKNDPSKNENDDESREQTSSVSVEREQETRSEDEIIHSDSEIEFSDASPNAQVFLKSVKQVYEMAYNGDYVYGNSKSVPPCADGIISGDRMISRALWDMGYTDQPTGGETDLSTYLPAHGFDVITDKSQLRAGDIVQITAYDRPDHQIWTYSFVLVSYDPVTEQCEKYDLTEYTIDGQSRIKCKQPFHALLEENGDKRVFKQAFRIR